MNEYLEKSKHNFKVRYPKLYHCQELIYHLVKEFLIFVCFIIFFLIIIIAQKNLINWGFQIILGIFLIAYVAVGNDEP